MFKIGLSKSRLFQFEKKKTDRYLNLYHIIFQAMKKFNHFLATQKKETRPIQNIPSSQLDTLLGSWIRVVAKEDGSNYEPDSLTALHRGVDR